MIDPLWMLLGVILTLIVIRTMMKPPNYPPGPIWLPFLGSFREFRALARRLGGQHLAFRYLSEKYKTNVLGFKFGNDLVVTVLNHSAVMDVLKSDVFDARPDNFFVRLRTMGQKIGITFADGEVWQVQRSFVVKQMRQLGFGKDIMENMIQDELTELLREIEQKDTTEVQLGEFISPAVISSLWLLTAGTRISRRDKRVQDLLKILRKRQVSFDLAGGILNTVPWLVHFAPNYTGYNLIMEMNRRMENFFMETIQSHYSVWKPGRNDDIIHAFITHMKANNAHPSFTVDQMIMICEDIFVAGSQTTSHTLDFAFMMMLLHPDIQKKVQKEIDARFGKDEEIYYKNRAETPYVEAVLMEVQRMYPVAAITGPRRTLRDITIEGYAIPKDTTVLISNYSVQMDEEYWGDPHVFRPERFIDEHGKLKPVERLIPFGRGKRRCPGETLARACIFLFFVGILRKYDITHSPQHAKPTGTPISGITLVPEEYWVHLTRRCVSN